MRAESACHKPEIMQPFAERVFTICIFVFGAVFFSFIYGNIGQFIESIYASGQRYRKRMDEINEFVRFHNLPPSLQSKIRSYVEFAFSVTKGINVESISQQLPAHLQLEIHLHLNKKMGDAGLDGRADACGHDDRTGRGGDNCAPARWRRGREGYSDGWGRR